MVGVKFKDPDGAVRGLAYSDFAVLLRSVQANGAPIAAALAAARIPYIVAGVMASITVTVYSFRNELKCNFALEQLKQQGLEIGKTLILSNTKSGEPREWKIVDIGLTHIKLEKDGVNNFISNKYWLSDFSIKESENE